MGQSSAGSIDVEPIHGGVAVGPSARAVEVLPVGACFQAAGYVEAVDSVITVFNDIDEGEASGGGVPVEPCDRMIVLAARV